jgi:hypothetical protein
MQQENIFCSDVAKRVGFWLTTHKLTPQLKGKKIQKKKLYILQHETYVDLKEERKEKEEKEGEGRRKHGRPTIGLNIAGHRRSALLRHPSPSARPSRGSGVTHVHLLRRILNPFRVNFQNLGFIFLIQKRFLRH